MLQYLLNLDKTESLKYYNVLQCNKLAKVIVSDASTLILLQKIALLDILVENFEFIISGEVYKESVIKGKTKNFEDAYKIDNKINNHSIKIKKVKNKEKYKEIVDEFGIGDGEAESIVLFLQEKADILAIDDHKSLNVCKVYNIPFMTALTFVVDSCTRKVIGKEESKKMIKDLSMYGRYKAELVYRALGCLEDKKWRS